MISRKFVFLFLLLLCKYLNIFSQAEDYFIIDTVKFKVQYYYQFQEDSTNKESVKILVQSLMIGNRYSEYLTENIRLMDSIRISGGGIGQNMVSYAMGSSHSFFSFDYIYKNYPQKRKYAYKVYRSKVTYIMAEDLTFNWNVDFTRDTLINGFKCTYAKCNFAGRNYNAWFAKDIPIPDGPYKFYGLPGLIVRIADTQEQHVFQLEKFTKVKYPLYIYNDSDENYKPITPKEFIQVIKANVAEKIQMARGINFNTPEDQARSIARLQGINNYIEKY